MWELLCCKKKANKNWSGLAMAALLLSEHLS